MLMRAFKNRQTGEFFIIALFIISITVLYLLGYWLSGEEMIFTGLLLNPIDGNSYLAKMYQGYQGEIRFRLPYTPEPGEGTYLFLFYLALGHLARVFHLPLILVFHLARIGGAITMAIVLLQFIRRWLGDKQTHAFTLSLMLFGSGMGWLGLFGGLFTMDFWVAEAFPFLAAYSSPHFSLGMAILLSMFIFSEGKDEKVWGKRQENLVGQFFLYFLASFLLATMSPFAVILGLVLLVGLLLISYLIESFVNKPLLSPLQKRETLTRTFGLTLGGLPLLVYDLVIVRVHPMLKGWDSQNVTLTPPLWDLLISFSPALLLAIIGVVVLLREKRYSLFFPVFWTLGAFLMAYMPIPLQRRFLFGAYIPIAVLATLGKEYVGARFYQKQRLLSSVIFCFSVITNIVILLSGLGAILRHDPRIFLTRSEGKALEWLSLNSPADSLVIASPEMGLFIPAYTGRRVLYGHPFETINAAEQRVYLEQVYSHFPSLTEDELLAWDVCDEVYIFYGEREKLLGEIYETEHVKLVFSYGEVQIFQVVQH